jgi:hypothetical protein
LWGAEEDTDFVRADRFDFMAMVAFLMLLILSIVHL